MPEISSQHVEKLASLLAAMSSIVEEMRSEPTVDPAIAARVEQLVAKRICLGCLEPVAEGDRYARGLHVNEYNAATKAWATGETSERQMIENGRITPRPLKGGRKALKPTVWNRPITEEEITDGFKEFTEKAETAAKKKPKREQKPSK